MSTDSLQTDLYLMLLVGTAVMMLLVMTIIIVVVMYRKKQLEHEKEKSRILSETQEELLNARLEIAEQIMEDIGNEMHDNVKNRLIALELMLRNVDLPPTETNREMMTVIDELKGDVSEIGRSLKGWYVPAMGLEQALEREARLLNQTGKIKCTVRFEETWTPMDPNRELVLFRCAQEAMHNALRHSGGTTLCVSYERTIQRPLLSITDNGKGLGDMKSNGIGLSNIQKRMNLLGGLADFKPGPDKGTRVELSF
jgi:two-component system, NarL family, sensor kinase